MITLHDALLTQFNKYKYTIPKNSKGIDKDILIEFLASRKSTRLGALGYSAGGWSKFIKKVFQDKPSNSNYYDWLLGKDGLKFCPNCEQVKSLTEFWKNSSKSSGINSYCTYCMKPLNREAHVSIQAKYKANKLNATPKWADLDKIRIFYNNCPENFHVDHIIPLQGKYVCGLHIENNLQYLEAKMNTSKSNYHESEEYWK